MTLRVLAWLLINLPKVLSFYPIQIYFFFLELLLEGKHLDLTVV